MRASTLCNHSFRQDAAVIKLAAKAAQSIKVAWNMEEDANILLSPFCDAIYIPELDMCTAALSSLAMADLQVHEHSLSAGVHADKFSEFVFCLKQERRRLDKARLEDFDRSWGIDAEGHFGVRAQRTVRSVLGRGDLKFRRVDELLQREILAACRHYATSLEQLQHQAVSPAEASVQVSTAIGVHLLHGFVADLLGRGTAAGTVYRTKTAEAG
jgi:hypothetical protein